MNAVVTNMELSEKYFGVVLEVKDLANFSSFQKLCRNFCTTL